MKVRSCLVSSFENPEFVSSRVVLMPRLRLNAASPKEIHFAGVESGGVAPTSKVNIRPKREHCDIRVPAPVELPAPCTVVADALVLPAVRASCGLRSQIFVEIVLVTDFTRRGNEYSRKFVGHAKLYSRFPTIPVMSFHLRKQPKILGRTREKACLR